MTDFSKDSDELTEEERKDAEVLLANKGVHYAQIERENEALRNECARLRKELSEVMQRNAAAACYATMWDGGRDYTKESVLDNLFAVREILAGDHKKVRELYESWKKNEEAMS